MKFLLIAIICILADQTWGGLAGNQDRLGSAHLPDLISLCTQEGNTRRVEASSNQRQALHLMAV